MKQGVVWVGLLGACADDPAIARPREPAVIVETFPGGTLIYQGDDGAWQPVPAFGDRFGFDVTDRYGVALVDPQRRVVDARFSTVVEQSHVTWLAPEAEKTPRHQITGTTAGTGEFLGRAAGGLETTPLRADQPYELSVPEGSTTLAFGRVDKENRVDKLILRRDLPIVGDRTIDVDLAIEGLASTSSGIGIAGDGGCVQRSVFSFDGTRLVLLETTGKVITFPHPSQWLATDRLTFEVECGGPTDRATLFQEIPQEHLIPTVVEAPLRIVRGELAVVDGRYRFGWPGYFEPVRYYELGVGCPGCARWTSQLSEGWLAALQFLEVVVLSPPDLAELGLLAPELVLPDTFEFSISAVVLGEHRRIFATTTGTVTP